MGNGEAKAAAAHHRQQIDELNSQRNTNEAKQNARVDKLSNQIANSADQMGMAFRGGMMQIQQLVGNQYGFLSRVLASQGEERKEEREHFERVARERDERNERELEGCREDARRLQGDLNHAHRDEIQWLRAIMICFLAMVAVWFLKWLFTGGRSYDNFDVAIEPSTLGFADAQNQMLMRVNNQEQREMLRNVIRSYEEAKEKELQACQAKAEELQTSLEQRNRNEIFFWQVIVVVLIVGVAVWQLFGRKKRDWQDWLRERREEGARARSPTSTSRLWKSSKPRKVVKD